MRAWFAVACLSLAGCVFVIDELPPGTLPDGGFDEDLDKLPPGGRPDGGLSGGGGAGGDGGAKPGGGSIPGRPPLPVPSDFAFGHLWLVRVDRGSVNLAATYEALVKRTVEGFAAAGVPPRFVAIAPLHAQTPHFAWARDPKHAPPVSIARALEAAASHAPDWPPPSCTTTHLAALGRQLRSVKTWYPPELRVSDSDQYAPFEEGVDALFVVIVDVAPRPYSVDDGMCRWGGHPPVTLYAQPTIARWIQGTTVPTYLTRFAFVATPEGADDETLFERCLASEGFPARAVDSIASSPIEFFGPLERDMNASVPGLAANFDFCDSLGAGWTGVARGLAERWAEDIARHPRTP